MTQQKAAECPHGIDARILCPQCEPERDARARAQLQRRIASDPALLDRLRDAAGQPMTAEQIEAQRQSWVRGMTGPDPEDVR